MPTARSRCHQTDVICANGMGWSPDNRTMYFTESFRYAIFAYDFDAAAGTISNRRVFASLDAKGRGFPDGLTVDAEGHVWSVHNAIGKVVRYTPDGEIERMIELPVPRPCGCTFGGEKLDTLYITTARETLTPEQIAKYPLSGSLFAAEPGVCGLPEAVISPGEDRQHSQESLRPARMTRQLFLGITLIVAAFFCVAVMSAFGKAASGVSTATISFFQSFISLLLFLPWTLRHGLADLKTTQLPLHVARALSGLLSQVLYFWAVKEMSLIDAVLLVNAAPLFIPLVALVWNRTPITPAVGISLLVGFHRRRADHQAGGRTAHESVGADRAVGRALLGDRAGERQQALRPEPARHDPVLLLLHRVAGDAAVCDRQLERRRRRTNGATWSAWACSWPSAQLLIILAYQHATASQIAPFNYSVVIFSGLIGWIVWHNTLDWISGVGILLVCVGGILSILLAPDAKHSARQHARAWAFDQSRDRENFDRRDLRRDLRVIVRVQPHVFGREIGRPEAGGGAAFFEDQRRCSCRGRRRAAVRRRRRRSRRGSRVRRARCR